MRLRSAPSPTLVIALVALAIALGSVAFAAPGDGPAINGCVDNVRGTLRVVDAGVACAAAETAVSWNKQGPAGVGVTGPQGPPGPPGSSTAPAVADPASTPVASVLNTAVKKPSKAEIKIKIKIPPLGEPTHVFEAVRNGPAEIAQAPQFPGPLYPTVARLVVPAGKYFVIAKGAMGALGQSGHPLLVPLANCRLRAGNVVDDAFLETRNTLLLTLAVRLSKPSAIELSCGSANAVETPLSIYRMRISAINVARISSKPTAPPF